MSNNKIVKFDEKGNVSKIVINDAKDKDNKDKTSIIGVKFDKNGNVLKIRKLMSKSEYEELIKDKSPKNDTEEKVFKSDKKDEEDVEVEEDDDETETELEEEDDFEKDPNYVYEEDEEEEDIEEDLEDEEEEDEEDIEDIENTDDEEEEDYEEDDYDYEDGFIVDDREEVVGHDSEKMKKSINKNLDKILDKINECNENDKLKKLLLENKKIREDIEAKTELKKIETHIDSEQPKLYDILKTPMDIKNKSFIYELFLIYKQMEFDEDKIRLRNQIKKLHKRYEAEHKAMVSFEDSKRAKMEEELALIESMSPKLNTKQQILALNTTIQNKRAIYTKYMAMVEHSDNEENSKLSSWIKHALSLPYDRIKEIDCSDNKISRILSNVYKIMNEELYGMQKVKEQILIFLNTKLRNSSTKGCSLGLIGSPGTGKTSIAKTIAKCLEFPFEQISFGNVSNAEFLTGHDYTYIGSRPGEIVRCLSRLGHKNGIIFMDEFDKVSEKPAIVNCLLHITDPSHNNEFKDNYLADITIDLSSIWFIYSMNNMPEDPALRDRLFVIEVEEYTVADKVEIIKNHIIPKTLRNIGLPSDSISIKEEDIKKFISNRHELQDERGVRTLEKTIKELINKVHFIVSNKMDGVSLLDFKVSFHSNKLDKYPVVLTTDIIDKFIPIKEKNIYREMFL